MAEDELLKSKNILPPDDENASRQVGPALLKLAGQLQPQVRPNLLRWVSSLICLFHLARIHLVCEQQFHQSTLTAHASYVPPPTQKHIFPEQ
jgi:hypothetical protein